MYDFFPSQLFHISEDPTITQFIPRPSPSFYDKIHGPVVFAITDQLLHHYLLPRDCPRVCFYPGADSDPADIEQYISSAGAGGQHAATPYVMALESKWLPLIRDTTIYCYELPASTFTLLDECAGYYVSYEPVVPVAVRPVNNLLAELLHRQVDVRFLPTLWPLAEKIRRSTLNFSLIRMRHAQR